MVKILSYFYKKVLMEFNIVKSLTNEYKHECAGTRKLLEKVPMDQLSWKPHEKANSLNDLVLHIVDLPNWVTATLERSELDFSTEPYNPKKAATVEELLKIHDDAVASALKSIANTNAGTLVNDSWTLRNGEQVYFTMPKIGVLRGFALNHLYHHRGQLVIYLRMLGVSLKGVGLYGPTAEDEM